MRGSRITVAVDPGDECGVAVFEEYALRHACLARPVPSAPHKWCGLAVDVQRIVEASTGPGDFLSVLAVEGPEIYRTGRADPNKMIVLAGKAAGVVGRLGDRFAEVVVYQPFDWKKNIPPEICVERAKSRLTLEERARVALPSRSLEHNVWDAVGIGLHRLGRLRV